MVKLKEHKELSENKSIERLPLPSFVYIPLSQHLGKPCEALVKVGDSVLTGQKIGSAQAHLYSPIHASISGKVSAIKNWPHPALGSCKAIVIESDGTDKRQESRVKSQEEVKALAPKELRDIIFEAGIVGMGGAGFPTHIKLTPPREVQTLILNAAECEPYLSSDYRLMLEKTDEIILGLELLIRCLAVRDVYIAIEDNKAEAIKKFTIQNSCLAGRQAKFKIKVLKTQYPQGGEKQLIKKILDKEVPSGKLPFDVGVVVHNVATAFAIYEAVYENKPLYERVVTVTGDCLENPKNLLVRIGTPIKELIDACGALKKNPAKIISGGPMMGIAQYTDQAPVTKTTSGIILLSEREVKPYLEDVCIRCGECIRNCPVGLQPCLISLAAEVNNWKLAESYCASDCIECGLCSYVCPAKRNLVQSARFAKLKVK